MKIKGKFKKIKDQYQQFMFRHRTMDKIANGAARVAKVSVGVAAVGAVSLGGLCALGYVIQGCQKVHRNHVLRPDDRSATLIEHQPAVQALYFDMDGNTNTAEAVVKYETECDSMLETVRQCRIGDAKKVMEWKKHLMADGCFATHFAWTDLKTRERDSL